MLTQDTVTVVRTILRSGGSLLKLHECHSNKTIQNAWGQPQLSSCVLRICQREGLKIAQRFRTLALAEYLGSASSTHLPDQNHLRLQFKGTRCLSDLRRHQTYIYAGKTLIHSKN